MGGPCFSSHSQMPTLEAARLPDTPPHPAPLPAPPCAVGRMHSGNPTGCRADRDANRPAWRSWEDGAGGDRRIALLFQQGLCSLPRYACGRKEGSFLKLRGRG